MSFHCAGSAWTAASGVQEQAAASSVGVVAPDHTPDADPQSAYVGQSLDLDLSHVSAGAVRAAAIYLMSVDSGLAVCLYQIFADIEDRTVGRHAAVGLHSHIVVQKLAVVGCADSHSNHHSM